MTKKWYNFFVVTEPQKNAGAATKKSPATRTSPSAPAAPRDGPQRVADLPAQAAPDPTFDTPVTDPTAFEDIYAAARIEMPRHGYTIHKVADMLKSEHLRDLPHDVRRKSILVALDAAGVPVTEIVEDAVQRDRALDAYERILEKNVEELRARNDAENRRLEEEVNRQLAAMKARIDENSRLVREEEASLAAWRTGKRQEEARIADAVNYFVSENPVTTSEPPPAQDGGKHVR